MINCIQLVIPAKHGSPYQSTGRPLRCGPPRLSYHRCSGRSPSFRRSLLAVHSVACSALAIPDQPITHIDHLVDTAGESWPQSFEGLVHPKDQCSESAKGSTADSRTASAENSPRSSTASMLPLGLPVSIGDRSLSRPSSSLPPPFQGPTHLPGVPPMPSPCFLRVDGAQ